ARLEKLDHLQVAAAHGRGEQRGTAEAVLCVKVRALFQSQLQRLEIAAASGVEIAVVEREGSRRQGVVLGDYRAPRGLWRRCACVLRASERRGADQKGGGDHRGYTRLHDRT